jgi:hypothetical protein
VGEIQTAESLHNPRAQLSLYFLQMAQFFFFAVWNDDVSKSWGFFFFYSGVTTTTP